MKNLLVIFILMFSIAHADTLPVASKDFPVEKITRFELRRIYFMKDRFVEGVGLVTLYQRPAHSAEHLRFIRETLDLTPASYFKELALSVNSGKGVVITVIDNDEAMIDKVLSRDNAIGYIDADTLIIKLDKSAKYLKVTD